MANSPKLRGTYDLLGIIILTALLTICIAFIPSDIPRIIVGLPFLLFFPGYTLLAALFPRKEGLTGIERVALSFGLSLAVVPLIGLVLNYLWEISVYPILVSVAVFVVAMCVLAYFRRRQLIPEQRFEPSINVRLPPFGRQSRVDRAFMAVLVVAMAAAVAGLAYVATHPGSEQEFTEFYLLGPSGLAEDYPSEIVLGASAHVIVGVTNHEGQDITYQVRISLGGTDLRTTDGIVLHNGENWEDQVVLAPTKAGDNQKVEFLLYRDGESEAYQELYLWIDVIDAQNP
ncbi:MAG: DUF1616 domain-containing protein [Dehalococcoidia bacterium]|nr:DUF1616 domain-containing protein [Dehalococcoidia bacterium]